jgi:uncharacterized membrane protein
MSDVGQDRAAPLAIGTVLGRAVGVMTGNPLTVFSIAFLFGALPQVLLTFFTQVNPAGDSLAQAGLVALYVGYFVVFILCSALSQAALVRATSAYLDGRVAGLAECVRAGIGKAIPVIGLSILFTLGLMFGLLLLVVPGIILFVRWSVASAALVEEDGGVIEAFSRSNELTRGARWHVFFLMIIVLVISWLISAIATVPALMAGLDQANAVPTATSIALTLVTSTITTALWSTVVTSLYFSLRDRRDGPRSQQLADVFA